MTSRPCWRRRPGVGGAGDDKPTVADVATHVPQVAHGNQTKQQVARCGPQSPWKPNKTLTASSALLRRHPLAARIFCTNVQAPPPRRGLARPRALTLDPDSKTATVRRTAKQQPYGVSLAAVPTKTLRIFLRPGSGAWERAPVGSPHLFTLPTHMVVKTHYLSTKQNASFHIF